MIKWFLLLVGGTGFSIFCYLYFYLGAYKDVLIEQQSYPTMHLVYLDQRGAYHNINSAIVKVENFIRDKIGVSCPKTFGHFLDNPKTTDEDRLRSEVGCVFFEDISHLNLKSEDLELKQKTVSSQSYLYGKFEGSPSIGPFIVYPALNEYAQANRILMGSTAYEIYTKKTNDELVTEYLFTMEK